VYFHVAEFHIQLNVGPCTWFLQMRNLESGEAEDLRSSLLDAVAQHGLVQ
jgi:hypothetical protein